MTKTVVKQVRPDVPAGAFLPSTHPALALTQLHGHAARNIGCEISGDERPLRDSAARLGRAGAAGELQGDWGDTIHARAATALPSSSAAAAARSPPNAKVIPAGWDDKVGTITCQVRSFGVNCFSTSRSGFIISRTGYSLY